MWMRYPFFWDIKLHPWVVSKHHKPINQGHGVILQKKIPHMKIFITYFSQLVSCCDICFSCLYNIVRSTCVSINMKSWNLFNTDIMKDKYKNMKMMMTMTTMMTMVVVTMLMTLTTMTMMMMKTRVQYVKLYTSSNTKEIISCSADHQLLVNSIHLSNSCPIPTIWFKLITLWTAWFIMCITHSNTSFNYCTVIVSL